MALTGLQIFKLMPKTNCKDCGHPTCLAFSMALAASKTTLDTCPHVSEEAKESLGAASAPPVAKIIMGKGEKAREMGDETVLFRHEKRFFHPTCISVSIADDLDEASFNERLSQINDLKFERVGEHVSIDAISLEYRSGDPEVYAAKAKIVSEKGDFAAILTCSDAYALEKALDVCASDVPLIYGANSDNYDTIANIAKKYDCPVVVYASTLDELSSLSEKVGAITKKIVLSTTSNELVQTLADLTQIRRQAIRKKVRPLGYPSLACVCGKDPYAQVADASVFISKYGSIVVMDTCEKSHILPLCALRQNIFSDPQKPAQVEPGAFAVGEADENSPVYCTTNFSLTYYTVEGEISSSKIPSWLVAVPTDGTSVLTAWAAGKFTGERIAEFIGETGLSEKVNHKNLVIPGHVAVLKAPIEENSDWKVIIGPNEASALPAFAKSQFQ